MSDDLPHGLSGADLVWLRAQTSDPDEIRAVIDTHAGVAEELKRVAALVNAVLRGDPFQRQLVALLHLTWLASDDPGDEINAAVREALEADDGPEAAWMLEDANRTRGELARVVRAVLRLAVAGLAPFLPAGLVTAEGLVDRDAFNALGEPTGLREAMVAATGEPSTLATVETDAGSICAWDDVLIRVLEAEGLATPEEAAGLRARRANSYRKHTEAGRPGDALAWWYSVAPEHAGAGRPVVLLGDLAERLWARRWREQVAEELAARANLVKNPAGLVTPVYGRIHDMLVRASIDRESGRIVGKDGRQLPLLPTTTLDRLAGLPALGTLTAQRLVRWLVRTATVGHWRGDGRVFAATDGVLVQRHRLGVNVEIIGGVARVMDLIGATSNRHSNEISDVLEVLRDTRMDWDAPGVRGSQHLLHSLEDVEAAPGRQARLTLGVGSLLCPGIAPKLPKGDPDRWVVPVLPMPDLSGLHSLQRTPATRLDWVAVRHLSDQRRDAARHGGVIVPWDALATRVNATRATTGKALELWSGGDAPRWVQVEDGRWMLGDADPEIRAARDFILEGGRASLAGSEGGRKSGEARRAKRDGRVPRKRGNR